MTKKNLPLVLTGAIHIDGKVISKFHTAAAPTATGTTVLKSLPKKGGDAKVAVGAMMGKRKTNGLLLTAGSRGIEVVNFGDLVNDRLKALANAVGLFCACLPRTPSIDLEFAMHFETETTTGEHRLLLYVGQPHAPLDRERIAKEVGLHPVTVSKAICSLERKGLLSIERNETYRQGRRGYSKVTVMSAGFRLTHIQESL